MAQARFQRPRLAGLVGVLPPVEKRIDDDLDQYGGNAAQLARIKKTIGLDRRRVVEPGTTAADLCAHGARVLLERSGLEPGRIGALVCVTQTPDHFQPCNAALLHGRLGLATTCAAFDVNLGCSGWVYALWLAFMMVETGSCEEVLVLAGDTVSVQCHPRDRAVAPLFGDAGSAAWVTAGATGAGAAGPSWFSLHTDGSGAGHIMVPAGAFRQPPGPEADREETDADGNTRSPANLRMSGADVFNFSITVEPAALRELAVFAGRPLEAAAYLFLHQANRYILGNIARRLRLPPERVPAGVVEKYGNQSSASVPVVVADTLGPGGPAAPLEAIVSGFGVGLSWAGAWLTLGSLACCELVAYPPRGGADAGAAAGSGL